MSLCAVNRGTVQHYLREGLLPRPVKTHRNMAYYDVSCVERIKQIRDLQSRRFLPLSVIGGLLKPQKGEGGLARSLVDAQQAVLSSLSPPAGTAPLDLDDASSGFGIEADVLRELAEIGLITPRESRVEGVDLEVLAAVAHLERLGFTRKLGFATKDLGIY